MALKLRHEDGGLRACWVTIREYLVVRTLKGIIIHSTDRPAGKLQMALAYLGGTVILKHYNETINRSFSLSLNKKVYWKPSSGRSQENEMS